MIGDTDKSLTKDESCSLPTYPSFKNCQCGGVKAKENLYLRFSFSKLCQITVLMPLVGLFFCLTTATIFQQEDIHETYCKVYNIVPSISSITGISPQRYFWRICIAFHVGPRILISLVYHSYYLSLLPRVEPQKRHHILNLIRAVFWLSILELCTLVGVTYVSNRENYPLHEKIFIAFMISSQTHMLFVLKLLGQSHAVQNALQRKSYKVKRAMFVLSLVCTAGLLIFFVKHRLYCHELAFSWFSFCEYWIAVANMAFHSTVAWDFPEEDILVGCQMAIVQHNQASPLFTREQTECGNDCQLHPHAKTE